MKTRRLVAAPSAAPLACACWVSLCILRLVLTLLVRKGSARHLWVEAGPHTSCGLGRAAIDHSFLSTPPVAASCAGCTQRIRSCKLTGAPQHETQPSHTRCGDWSHAARTLGAFRGLAADRQFCATALLLGFTTCEHRAVQVSQCSSLGAPCLVRLTKLGIPHSWRGAPSRLSCHSRVASMPVLSNSARA